MNDDALELFGTELDSVPPIDTLDEYMHLEEQLKKLRVQGGSEFNLKAFAMQMAVYLRLVEYDERLGLPNSIMPGTDGSIPTWQALKFAGSEDC